MVLFLWISFSTWVTGINYWTNPDNQIFKDENFTESQPAVKLCPSKVSMDIWYIYTVW